MSVIWYPVSRIIRAYLVAQGVGVNYSDSADWPIATAACPDSPNDVITIYDEAAVKRGRTIEGVQDDPVVLIEVRSKRPEPGQYKAKEIQEAMDSLSFWQWAGDSAEYSQTIVFANARRARGIFPLGRDEKENWKLNLEYALVVQSIT
jgi:hypothetical protein